MKGCQDKVRGRTIALAARVLPTPAGNVAAGLDVAAWIQEGLLDFAVPSPYVDEQFDGFPLRGTRRTGPGNGLPGLAGTAAPD